MALELLEYDKLRGRAKVRCTFCEDVYFLTASPSQVAKRNGCQTCAASRKPRDGLRFVPASKKS